MTRGLFTLLLCSGFMNAAPVWPHAYEWVRCGLHGKMAYQIGKATVMPNGLMTEAYDTNGDGKIDLEIQSVIEDTVFDKDASEIRVTHKSLPLFWVYDNNYDGAPDVVYHDKHGEGRCEDIVVYKLLGGKDS